MGNIILLDEITANKIAAGEVVERPASVVKEMIENSIDAKAKTITVEIQNGGISQIRIIDNGTGIASDDIEIAFERYSTSKIRSAVDLDSISTLGFRGEALASISSVSKVELISRQETEKQGMFVKVEGGKLIESRPIGCPVGTTFIVSDLFYNTPARYKFLKKDATEASYILDIINRVALARSDISFKFMNKGKTILHTPGNGDLKSTIFSIYGRDVSNNILEINYEDDNLKIKGFIGKAQIARGNRNQQSLYLNSRYIKSKVALKAIEEAYKTFLMKGKYPFYVLNIEIDPMFVDVNVHPSKMEVRFWDEQKIFRSIYNAISTTLLDKSTYRELPKLNDKKETDNYVQTTFIKKSFDDLPKISAEKNNQDEKFINKMIEENLEKNRFRFESSKSSREVDEQLKKKEDKVDYVNENLDKIKKIVYLDEYVEEEKVGIDKYKTDLKYITNSEVKDKVHEGVANNLLVDCIIIGQLFGTYILLQRDNDFYVIDQHAAHERVMFEKLRKSYKNDENMTQPLLEPIVIEMQANDIKSVLENKERIEKIGFEVCEFGVNALIIRGVPAFSDEDNIKDCFLDIVDRLILNKSGVDNMDEALYDIACKSAIKANKKMDDKEIRELLCQLDKLKNPFTCPHGRPTAIKLTKREVEKMFKRIV